MTPATIYQIHEDNEIIAWAKTMKLAHAITQALRTENYKDARLFSAKFKEYRIVESTGFYA
jgi:hypothetical protein